MTDTGTPRALRRDAGSNRSALVAAARKLFAIAGPAAPLENVARAAGVSRTTLYRHFRTREELAATILEANVAEIESEAARLSGRPDGARRLFDFVLEMQRRDRVVAHLLSGTDESWFESLSKRTSAAFFPLVTEARRAGAVHPEVEVHDFLLAFPMASGVHLDASTWGHVEAFDRTQAMLHRALFTA